MKVGSVRGVPLPRASALGMRTKIIGASATLPGRRGCTRANGLPGMDCLELLREEHS